MIQLPLAPQRISLQNLTTLLRILILRQMLKTLKYQTRPQMDITKMLMEMKYRVRITRQVHLPELQRNALMELTVLVNIDKEHAHTMAELIYGYEQIFYSKITLLFMNQRIITITIALTAILITGIVGYYFLSYIPGRDQKLEERNVNSMKAEKELDQRNTANAYLSCVRVSFTINLKNTALENSVATLECWKNKECLSKQVDTTRRIPEDECIQKFPEEQIEKYPDLLSTYNNIFLSAKSSLGNTNSQ